MWIIGDAFLRNIHAALQNMRSEAAVNRKDDPYLYQFFNVMIFYQKSNGKANSALMNIYNSLVEGLNKYARLPRFIIVIPDRDLIIQANHFSFGMNIIIEQQIKWLMKKFERAFQMRRVDLKDKCLGSVGHEPRIIWVKMIQRPLIKGHQYKYYNNIVNLRRKFNRTIDEYTAVTRNTHVIDTSDAFDEYVHYDHLGNLAHEGKSQFWRLIDGEFRKYDKGEVDLLPETMQRKGKSSTKENTKPRENERKRNHDTWEGPHYDENPGYEEYYTSNHYDKK